MIKLDDQVDRFEWFCSLFERMDGWDLYDSKALFLNERFHKYCYFEGDYKLYSAIVELTCDGILNFGVLKFEGAIWDLKFLIYSATGQDFYSSTRPATLNGVDGIIFVVDSQKECLEHNLRSWRELKTLFGREFYNIPIVISLNKYDLDHKDKLDENDFTDQISHIKFKKLALTKTTAINGEGIVDSFNQLIKFLFPQLVIKLEV